MSVPYFIVVEPQDYAAYAKHIDKKKILTLPFSNHGEGPGPARNWCWNHSISLGAKRHWVLDDNIDGFYSLIKNKRTRVNTGSIFRRAEEIVDLYENVPVAGFNYRFFVVPTKKKRTNDVTYNTRIYSCLLIENSSKNRWRGRYNEDTDLSLRVLKDGDCTIQFNIFSAGKIATQVLKGGNTQEFYHAEGEFDSEEDFLNPLGTVKKSQMLVDMHPDVARLSWKHRRYHHHVDYSPFKNNRLRRVKPS
jgi:hypothetical protein